VRGLCAALSVAAALLLAGALYFPALRGAFISDDRVVVAGNPATESPAAAMLAFARPFWHGLKSANPYYRPLPVLSWALDRSVAGGSTIPYHASSIALHAINALLAAWLVGVLIGWRRALPGAGAAGMAIAAALVVAHPIHTEPVAAIYGRPDLLSATGVLLFLNFALRGRAIAAFVALGAALLSKESAILIPLLAPVIFGAGRELLARSGAGRATATAAPLPALHRHPLLLGVAGAGIVGGIYLSLRHAALGALVDPGPVSRLDNPLAAAGSVERWMTPFAVAARSAALWLRPTPLCADRGFDVTPIASGPGDPHRGRRCRRRASGRAAFALGPRAGRGDPDVASGLRASGPLSRDHGRAAALHAVDLRMCRGGRARSGDGAARRRMEPPGPIRAPAL